ncbi:C45 family autoproteolytic acyltransferase/hydolase [Sphingobacterium humi]|uniref:Acyl-CoA--6-aminopenicillanic acid acyl-transferase n=1 Tax=Sphingobacterium humi TaxID=1796905 RepID=A0A6N8KYM1_9SPHI|nr:C45 family peptidase [Sphingobacterium humi]MVZ62560.1 acyl-CoA--6-aminopenicillanic acid acyl-transferase [Sphingobacterium humi]
MPKYLVFLGILLLFSGCRSVRHLKQETTAFKKAFDSSKVHLTAQDRLSQSPHGNWQLQVQGNPFELGYKRGVLTKDLYQFQEKAFFQQVETFIPKPGRQRFLIKFLKWYLRDILEDIPLPYRQEIFGLSRVANQDFDWVGSKYERALLLHGAHDIGHALQDLMLVGCSSVALWDQYTEDGQLLIGRNFDFYINADFAKHKLVEFVKPAEGYQYAAVSWPGMIGVVSGMNEKGLSISINASKSNIPLKGKTPISLVSRSILQHAQNIEEAIALAKTFDVFIAESLLIGSAQDNRAVSIEISPKNFDVYEVGNGILFCTNHFQSTNYSKDKRNNAHRLETHSQYRLEKLHELFPKAKPYNQIEVAQHLRDISGLQGKDIGLGNEKSLNQLMAHHAVIFKPGSLHMWVSNSPYQLGAFDAYDLKAIFEQQQAAEPDAKLTIPADSLIHSPLFQNYRHFKQLKPQIERAIQTKKELPNDLCHNFEQLNPNLWLTHSLLGDYYYSQKDWEKALHYYEIAGSKEISSDKNRKNLDKKRLKAKKKYDSSH